MIDIQQLHQLFLESTGVTTDTRKIKSNELFFALKGDNFNGNTFAWQAIKKGAGYAVIDEQEHAQGEQYIVVDDVLNTLQELANYHRRHLQLPILAITGSNGKTTSKEVIAAVLKRKFEVVATNGNLNNHIGVPLTLLSFKESTEFGVVEMGANHHGEIKQLCEIAEPDYGYITNFGKAHLEGFGSLEGVVKAKSEMYDHLKKYGKLLFLNADDPLQAKHLEYPNTFSFGESTKADVSVSYPGNNSTALVKQEKETFTSQLTGSYNAVNIAAALCIGSYFKVPTEGVKKAVAAYSPQNNRSQIVKLDGVTLLMDAYNANPTSMKAALESFLNYPAEDKSVILGDMFELGKDAEKEHQDIVDFLSTTTFTNVYLVGKNFSKTKTATGDIRSFENFDELEREIRATNFDKHHLLIKGSRGMALERIIDVLKQK